MPRLARVGEFKSKSNSALKRMNQDQIEAERKRLCDYIAHQRFVAAIVRENISKAEAEADRLYVAIWPYYESEMIAAGIPK